MDYDFCGWATKNDLRCADGRIIRKDAFKHNDGETVPLVWNHLHNEPSNILGHALLENRDEGVYAYCFFNDTEPGNEAKELVKHKDVTKLSIYANQLKQQGCDVLHGAIREVSLVLAGANPGAYIEQVLSHGEALEDEGIIYTDEEFEIAHSATSTKETPKNTEKENPDMPKETTPLAKDEADNEETVQDVFDTLNEKQKTVVYALIGQALADAGKGEDTTKNNGGTDNMKHNVFDEEDLENETTLSHADMDAIFHDAQRGSLKDAVLAHGIDNIDYLFPDAQNATPSPILITRDMGWVAKVMTSVHHTPFSRVKSIEANLTEDYARAKGYIKGKLKKDEVFALLKRQTTPQTIYKKQKLERDDIIDITDFDVVAWLKSEMRLMLDEEIARAILVGDGRLSASDDKINEANIRPIWKDEDLYTIKAMITVATNATASDKAKQFIQTVIKSRKDYKGSGDPVLYTTEDMLTDCLLIEDTTGRVIYDSQEKLATALRVKEIITAPVMENQTRTTTDSKTATLLGLVVNLVDYNVGADKGGAINLFDDFDIDYNAQKYLIETRCSGALIKPYSAIAIESVPAV